MPSLSPRSRSGKVSVCWLVTFLSAATSGYRAPAQSTPPPSPVGYFQTPILATDAYNNFSPWYPRLADLNNDGIADLYSGELSGVGFTTWLGTGNNALQPGVFHPTV